jgi:hypothetical protein
MRVYIPATLPVLARLLSVGALEAPVRGYGVTPVLRGWADELGVSDDEELEFVALSEAARASLRLLAAGDAAPVRTVLAADVADASVRVEDASDAAGPGQVVVSSPLQLGWVRAAHLDHVGAAADVRAAALAVVAADAGDAASEEVVARLDDHGLLWYAPDELPAVVASSP